MTTVLLNPQNLEYLKKLARERNPELGSSHLTEALAAGLGFSKHASLLSALKHPSSRLHAVVFSSLAFRNRLTKLISTNNEMSVKVELDSLQLNQQELPISCWQTYQSDALYHQYSRLNLPIIFKKDEKRKYCSLDYDYHFPKMHEIQKFDFDNAKTIAIKQLYNEFLRLTKLLELPKALFDGHIVTGWVTNVPITSFDSFADCFALAYFNIIRDLESEIDKYRPSMAA